MDASEIEPFFRKTCQGGNLSVKNICETEVCVCIAAPPFYLHMAVRTNLSLHGLAECKVGEKEEDV